MAERGNTGLEADVGITLGKITKQLAAVEARALRAAKKVEGDFANSNTRIVRSFQQVEKATGSAFGGQGLRQASMQLSQVAQQGAATGNYLQALAIQLPDLALGLGTVGIFAGIAAGALLPLVAGFLGAGDSAEDLKNRMKALKDLADGLDVSLDLLKMSATELGTKYGEAAERVRLFALAQAELRVDQATSRLNEHAGILRSMTTDYITSSESGLRFENTLGRITEAFGANRSEAIALEGAFQQLYQADTFSEQQAALQTVLSLMQAIKDPASELPPEFAAALDEMITLSNETDAARELMNALGFAADTVASSISGAATQASILAQNARSAVAAFNAASAAQYQASGTYGQVGARGDPRGFGNGPTPQLGEDSRNLITAANVKSAKAAKSGGGGGSKKKEDDPISGQDEIDRLMRQIEAIGKTDAAIASMTAKYKLLDEAKKRGLDLDKAQAGSSITLRQEIEQQATAIGALTEKYDAAKEQAQFYEGIQQDLQDGFLDAIVAGESFAGVLQGVAQALAKAALQAAIFGTGPMSGGGGGLGGLFTGLFNRASGGPVRAGQPYRVNEQTPNSEIFVPSTNGAILNSSQAQKALGGGKQSQPIGGGAVDVRVALDQNGNLTAHIEQVSGRVAGRVVEGNNKAIPAMIQKHNREPRKR